MTLSRRGFTFASLIAAISPAASAAEPSPSTIPELDEPPAPGARLQVSAAVTRRGETLEVTLQVANRGEAVDLLVAEGSRPASRPEVFALVDADRVPLAPILGERDRREMLSRIGPLPRFQTLEPEATIALGPHAFQGPRGGARGALYGALGALLVEGSLITSLGEVPFRLSVASPGDPAAKT
jgi:hypothetical protein